MKYVMILFLSAMGSLAVQAAPTSSGGVQYVYLQPSFVVNYGDTGRMRYLKTDVALKVSGPDAAAKIAEYKPHLRNSIIMLLSAQNPNDITSADGREALRKKALDDVRALMLKLDGSAHINDLYFSNFVAQN